MAELIIYAIGIFAVVVMYIMYKIFENPAGI